MPSQLDALGNAAEMPPGVWRHFGSAGFPAGPVAGFAYIKRDTDAYVYAMATAVSLVAMHLGARTCIIQFVTLYYHAHCVMTRPCGC